MGKGLIAVSPGPASLLQRNKYVNAVGATSDCTWCSRGYETQDTGNSECTPCSAGFYNPKTADQSTTPACIAAPQGTVVNTTGAFFASLW